MSEALFERYKEALRRGHVAALRGRDTEALAAYSEAGAIAPDRALPLVSQGAVLSRLGRSVEALAAYDAALASSPADEAALRGRADLLRAGGDRSGAAASYDRLAVALDAAGRLPDAADAARQALESAESRGRRSTMQAFVARLTAMSGDPGAAEALGRASSILEGGPGRRPPGPTAVVDADRVVERAPAGPPAPAEPLPPPFDPVRAIGEVEEAVLADDAERARSLALAASAGHRTAGQPSTAIDACYMALAGTPADPGLHLALTELYLDQGWRALAAEKLVLLARLADLTDDAETRVAVCAVVTARLPDDTRVAQLCA